MDHTWHNLKTQQYVNTTQTQRWWIKKTKKKRVSYNSNLGGATKIYSHLQMKIQIQKVKLQFHDFSTKIKKTPMIEDMNGKNFSAS